MTNEELVEQIQSGVNITENMYQLYEHNRGIIYKMANRYSWGAPVEDLTQEAYISLCKAVKKYDKQQDIKFVSYFSACLANHLKKYIQDSGRVIRIPVYKQEQIWKYNQVSNSYMHRFGREPSTREFAICMGLNVKQVEELERFMFAGSCSETKSLNQQLRDRDDECLNDSIGVECEDLDSVLDKLAYEQLWQEIERKLKPREYDIMYLRYRLNLSREETGRRLGMSRWAVDNAEYRAIRKLKYNTVVKDYAEYAGFLTERQQTKPAEVWSWDTRSWW
jgi:RNA polymerase sigma factor (sigma-70 family)